MRSVIKAFININAFLGMILVLVPSTYVVLKYVDPKSTLASEAFYPEKETEILLANKQSDQEVLGSSDTRLNLEVPKNEVVSYGNRITIPSIGLDTDINESQNAKLALERGVWRDPDHGMPGLKDEPIVIAAHRWGADNLSWDYRDKNLFAGFDRLRVGDLVFVNWAGKEYRYQIEFIEVNTFVSRLSDLIMYTCVDYYSDQRIFVFAKEV